MSNKEFSDRIKELREKKGLSQDELANLSGLSLRTVQRIERNETNPLGDTKRKVLRILESHPDTDFSNESDLNEKNDFLITVIKKYQYPLIMYIFSLLLISVGLSGLTGILLLGFIIGFISIVILAMSTVYHLKKKSFKQGLIFLMFSLTSLLIYIFMILWFVPIKSVQNTSTNDVTISIERNLITGKSDTTIIK